MDLNFLGSAILKDNIQPKLIGGGVGVAVQDEHIVAAGGHRSGIKQHDLGQLGGQQILVGVLLEHRVDLNGNSASVR